MRVALVTDTFDEVNGVGHTLRGLADWCAGHEVALHVFCNGSETGVEQRGSVEIHRFAPRWPVRYYDRLTWDLAPRPDVLAALAAGAFDLYHLPTPGAMGWHGALSAAILGRRCLGSYHTCFGEYAYAFCHRALSRAAAVAEPCARLARAGMMTMLRAFYGRCERILVPSPKALAEVESLVRRPTGFFRRGVDTERFRPRRRPANPRPVALYVGRLSVEKNVAALRDLAALGERCDLLIVGDGPARADLEQALPAARFTGYLYGEALAEAYASADLFVFPSLTDTLGNVVLEAKASGLPPIVLDAGGPGSLVRHGVDGYIARDRREMAELVALLAGHAGLREQLGRAARAWALRRRWDDAYRELHDHWSAVAQRGHHHAHHNPALHAG